MPGDGAKNKTPSIRCFESSIFRYIETVETIIQHYVYMNLRWIATAEETETAKYLEAFSMEKCQCVRMLGVRVYIFFSTQTAVLHRQVDFGRGMFGDSHGEYVYENTVAWKRKHRAGPLDWCRRAHVERKPCRKQTSFFCHCLGEAYLLLSSAHTKVCKIHLFKADAPVFSATHFVFTPPRTGHPTAARRGERRSRGLRGP